MGLTGYNWIRPKPVRESQEVFPEWRYQRAGFRNPLPSNEICCIEFSMSVGCKYNSQQNEPRFSACKSLAVAILSDAVGDIQQNKFQKGIDLAQRARTWIFADRFTEDFEFWCEVAGIEPKAIRTRLEKR